jgi:ketosteroid isomerase-like protein
VTDLNLILDQFQIESLRGEFTDAGMRRDYDRFSSLFTLDGVWRMPHVNAVFSGADEIRDAVERGRSLWEFFIQTVHPGSIDLRGDHAFGRCYVSEFGRLHGGASHSNYAVYHDRYRRTSAGWRFAERNYEVLYVDTTPLPGAPPGSSRDGQNESGIRL